MNKKLMRFAALLLAAAMLFSFSACRTNDDGSESSTDEPSVTDAGNIHEESTDSAELTTDEPTTDSRTVTRSNVSGGTKTETVNVYKGAQLHEHFAGAQVLQSCGGEHQEHRRHAVYVHEAR
ncbi:MAG: hypothetical protein ACLTSF_12245 [Acutalibacteraceae bacterium]